MRPCRLAEIFSLATAHRRTLVGCLDGPCCGKVWARPTRLLSSKQQPFAYRTSNSKIHYAIQQCIKLLPFHSQTNLFSQMGSTLCKKNNTPRKALFGYTCIHRNPFVLEWN